MPATVTEIVPVADSAARSMEIRLETDAQTGLMPGLYAQLQLPLAPEKGVLIDLSWVHQYGQLSMVYLLENNQIVRRYVRLGEMVDGQQHIVSGLNPGDVLAVDFKAK